MTRFDSKITINIIKKIHNMLLDVKSGEEVLDFLRDTEPIFMKEVARFVEYEINKLKDDEIDDDTLMYVGSAMGAAYVMGFLIARELDHKLYDGLIDINSVFEDILSPQTKKTIPKDIKKTQKKQPRKITKPRKKSKNPKIEFNEEEL